MLLLSFFTKRMYDHRDEDDCDEKKEQGANEILRLNTRQMYGTCDALHHTKSPWAIPIVLVLRLKNQFGVKSA